MECEYCKKILSTPGNLNYHKKTNKSCLKLRGKTTTGDDENTLIVTCEYCNKTFSKQSLITHNKVCKNKKIKDLQKIDDLEQEIHELKLQIHVYEKEKDNEIKLLKHKIKLLKDENTLLKDKIKIDNVDSLKEEIIQTKELVIKLETENKIYKKDHELVYSIAKEPKNTYNDNKIINTTNIFNDIEKVKQIVNDKLDKEYVLNGQKGIARFTANNLLKDENGMLTYFCSDPSRLMFKYRNPDGTVKKDIKSLELTNLLFEAGLKDKSNQIATLSWTKDDGTIDQEKYLSYVGVAIEILTMNSDNSTFRNELACLTSNI